MRRFAALLVFLILPFFAASALAEGMPSLDDIQKEMKKDEIGEDEEKVDGPVPEDVKIDVPPLPEIKMVRVKGGCYDMGDFTGDGDDDERPVHQTCVSDFYLMEHEVTQAIYEAVMVWDLANNKPFIKAKKKKELRERLRPLDPNMPAMGVSWYGAREFITVLNKMTKGFYRLPSEAEWEYAARSGGKKDLWSGVNNEGELGDYSWFVDNSDDVKPIKKKKPNALGLYDMSGNVWEWTEDNFDFDYYQVSPKRDPIGPDISYWRVIRGGSFVEPPFKLRTTYRHAFEPSRSGKNLGFRLAE